MQTWWKRDLFQKYYKEIQTFTISVRLQNKR